MLKSRSSANCGAGYRVYLHDAGQTYALALNLCISCLRVASVGLGLWDVTACSIFVLSLRCFSPEKNAITSTTASNTSVRVAAIAWLTFQRSSRSASASIIVNGGEWLWNSSKFFVVCYCSVFWPWPCTKHNSCLLLIVELTNRKVLVT